MSDHTLLAAYDAELRGEHELRGATDVSAHGPLWWGRYGAHGMVSYERDADVGDELIAAAIAHFRDETDVVDFEWKTRGHDDLPDLDVQLRSFGFVPDEVETVMIGEAELLAASVDLPDGITVRRAGTGADLLDDIRRAQAMQDSVFGRPSGQSAEELAALCAAEDHQIWLAEVGGQVVCAGRLVVVSGTDFAGLWGGATLAEWRGRGIYRALTAARARAALDLGVRYLHSDCSSMSRPILERSGLVAVTTTTAYVWQRPSAP
ncbi:MAG: GNAT family N-acetyltransferase [Nocardioides sp.]